MKNIKILMLGFFFGLFACTSVLDEVDLDTAPKYTVSCFLSPEDTVQLYLSLTFPINKEIDSKVNKEKISKAQVFILNEKNEKLNLIYNDKKKLYIAENQDFKIENNKKYFLEIETIEGNILKSNCTIPTSISDFKIKADSVNGTFFVTYEWQDFPNETNYYRYIGKKKNITFKNENTIYWTDGSQVATQIKTDDKSDGKLLQSNRADVQKTTDGFNSTAFNAVIEATLLHIDQNYYLFQQSIEKSQVGNNFEPTPIFSNIQGGLGVFGGCSIKRKVQRIR